VPMASAALIAPSTHNRHPHCIFLSSDPRLHCLECRNCLVVPSLSAVPGHSASLFIPGLLSRRRARMVRPWRPSRRRACRHSALPWSMRAAKDVARALWGKKGKLLGSGNPGRWRDARVPPRMPPPSASHSQSLFLGWRGRRWPNPGTCASPRHQRHPLRRRLGRRRPRRLTFHFPPPLVLLRHTPSRGRRRVPSRHERRRRTTRHRRRQPSPRRPQP